MCFIATFEGFIWHFLTFVYKQKTLFWVDEPAATLLTTLYKKIQYLQPPSPSSINT